MILADEWRHLVCLPYSRANLHRMAREFGIGRHWFHNHRRWPHYDIPKRRLAEILADERVTVVSPRELLAAIKQDLQAHSSKELG